MPARQAGGPDRQNSGTLIREESVPPSILGKRKKFKEAFYEEQAERAAIQTADLGAEDLETSGLEVEAVETDAAPRPSDTQESRSPGQKVQSSLKSTEKWSEMEKKQKIILWIAIFIIVGMLLYPPWHVHQAPKIVSGKYGFLFAPPRLAKRVETSRLTIQVIIILMLAAGLTVTSNKK
ncbi:MAG: hypothetical protein L6422_02425 [Candidatus Marinimicrobia bacterium]|nr:hypothetical protein [Candidatus Neomarinimicrobiota bacterium]